VEQIEAAQAETLLDLGGVATVADLDEMDAESIEAEPGA
jgi:hypothetical protein